MCTAWSMLVFPKVELNAVNGSQFIVGFVFVFRSQN